MSVLDFPLLVLTDRRQARGPLVDVIAAAAAGGARLVILREKDLPTEERADLADQIERVLAPVDGYLVVAGLSRADSRADSRGQHLAADDPWPRRTGGLLGRSCHNLAEVAAAATGGADYATLSPIFPSLSKPGYGPPLRLEVLAAPARIPVYALGGVDTPQRVRRCVRAGATGVAVMGALMRATDPAALTAQLIAAAGR